MTISKTEQFKKGECQLIILKQRRGAAHDALDAHRGFSDSSRLFISTAVGQSDVEEWTKPVGKDWIKALWISPCYPKTIRLGKYDDVTPFSDTVLIPHITVPTCMFQK